MRIFLFILILVVLAAFGLTFGFRNPGTVPISYYGGIEREIPVAGLVVGTLVVGFILGWLFRTLSVMKASGRARRAERRLGELETEVTRLSPEEKREDVI